MKITDLQVTSFGHWNGLQLRDLSDGVNVIYGPNEAGKSTLLQFIRAVLYGFSPERHKRFVPPVYDGKVGGEVSVQSSMGRYRIHRHLPEPGRLADHDRAELMIQATNGTKAGRHLLANILSGVDEAIFHNVFAVGLTEMQQLGTLSDTAASQQLYGLAMGTDRVSLMEVTQSLEQDRLQLIASDDRDCGVVQFLRQKERLIREIQATQQDNQRWGSLMKEHKDIDKEIAELEAQKVQFAQEGDIREIVAQLRSKWNSCQEIHDQLQAFGTVTPISSEWMKRIKQTNQEIKDKRNQWSKIKQQRAELKSQADALPAPSDTSRFAAEIELLVRRKGQFKTLRHDIERLAKQSEEAEFEIQAEMERLGVKSSYSYDRMPVITDDMVVSLRGPARECKDAKELIEECERNAKQYQEEAEKHQRNMQIATSRFGDQDLTKILLSLQTQTDHLEAKLNLENQQAKLKRTEKSLREELFTWQERMVLPWRVLMFLGLIFAAGVVVSLIGLTGNYLSLSDDKRWMMGIIGMAISAFAIIMKNVSQFGAARGADACEDELESLDKKLSLLHRDAEELDKHIPDEPEPLTTRLEAKEAAIDELQEFLPLENQRRQALERSEDALRQKEFATRQLQDARQLWRNSLVSLGLPESLTPSQFAKLTEQTGKMGHLRERILRARHDLDQKQQELRLAEQRIDSLMAGLSLIPIRKTWMRRSFSWKKRFVNLPAMQRNAKACFVNGVNWDESKSDWLAWANNFKNVVASFCSAATLWMTWNYDRCGNANRKVSS
ncbi:MAG: AAA family ATPase [Pirellulaceae bacterium]